MFSAVDIEDKPAFSEIFSQLQIAIVHADEIEDEGCLDFSFVFWPTLKHFLHELIIKISNY